MPRNYLFSIYFIFFSMCSNLLYLLTIYLAQNPASHKHKKMLKSTVIYFKYFF